MPPNESSDFGNKISKDEIWDIIVQSKPIEFRLYLTRNASSPLIQNKPHRCPACGRAFLKERQLKQHLRDVHPDFNKEKDDGR